MLALVLSLGCSVTGFAQGNAVSLFDGKSLDGWKVMQEKNLGFWSVVDGVITGSNNGKKVPSNTYLVTEKEYKDFELRCLFRISGDHKTGLINSGIQYRSEAKHKMVGYQADIGRGYWGNIYDEHRRNRPVAKADLSVLKQLLKEDGWNSYIVRCEGDRHQLYINGVKVVDYVEKESKFSKPGVIGMQLHSGGVAKVEFKNIVLEEL